MTRAAAATTGEDLPPLPRASETFARAARRRPAAEGRGEGRLLITALLAVSCFILHPSSLSPAGTLRTADGRTIEGDVRLEPDGQISVAPTRMGAGKPEKFDLSQVLQATFRN